MRLICNDPLYPYCNTPVAEVVGDELVIIGRHHGGRHESRFTMDNMSDEKGRGMSEEESGLTFAERALRAYDRLGAAASPDKVKRAFNSTFGMKPEGISERALLAGGCEFYYEGNTAGIRRWLAVWRCSVCRESGLSEVVTGLAGAGRLIARATRDHVCKGYTHAGGKESGAPGW